MEDLVPALIVLIAGIVSAVSKAKKEQEKKAAVERHKEAAAVRMQAAAAKKKAAAQEKPAPQPPSTAADDPKQVAAPTVHTHLTPDCDVHDAAGSLNFTTTEGEDPCHEDQLTDPRTAGEPAAEQSGLTFDWSGKELVRAVVMQEILTRPAQRRAR